MIYQSRADFPEPVGIQKIVKLNWILVFCVVSLAALGFVVQYSVAGGSATPWAAPQLQRFGVGFIMMLTIAVVPINFWRSLVIPAYVLGICLLILVEFWGVRGMGAQRWLDIGFVQIQPSELMKIVLIMALAAYYDNLDPRKVSHPFWLSIPVVLVIFPVILVALQPDLGTAILIALGGGIAMFVAGVSLYYFGAVFVCTVAFVAAVLYSRGTPWQLLKDYQYGRIDSYLDPSLDPTGAGYHITQSKIALGSGGISGRGFLNGSQSQLNFLPEKHTDFVFTTLAEEFGLIWGLILLTFYSIVVAICIYIGSRCKDRFQSILVLGLAGTFFLYFSLNLAMVTGLAPVVGIPLPFISYGGSAMLTLLIAFGLIQSCFIHSSRD